MNLSLWIAAIVTAGISLLSPLLFKPCLVKRGVVDIPNARSSHEVPTVRGGGIGPLLAMSVGGTVSIAFVAGLDRDLLAVIVISSLVIGVLGLAEDLWGVRVIVRFSTQIFIGIALAIFILVQTSVGWIWLPALAIGFAANVNFTNFMDGINGISSLHGLVAGLSFAVIGALTDTLPVTIAGALIVAAFLPFLPWNLARQKMFLGDVGSYFLGSLLGSSAVVAIGYGVPFLASIAPLTIYWVDTTCVIFKRLLRKERIFEPHRNHVYQRLTQLGMSHISVAVIVAVMSALSGIVGAFLAASTVSWSAGLLLLVLLGVFYLLLPGVFGFRLSRRPLPPSVGADWLGLSEDRTSWTPSSWVVVGASGFIGSSVTRTLQGSGQTVRSLQAPRLKLSPNISSGGAVLDRIVESDELDILVAKLRGADVVVNAAGLASPDDGHSPELYGANTLLPSFLAIAATRAEVGRVIHLSSAAVQGNRMILDETLDLDPSSAYSRSKALGELGLIALRNKLKTNPDLTTDISIVRATSVQGPERRTTAKIIRIARSWVSSVAYPGNQPSVVSSVNGLSSYIEEVGEWRGPLPAVVLQPWEGLSVTDVLLSAGGRTPITLPRWLCAVLVWIGKFIGVFIPKLYGFSRRVEVLWFGQQQLTNGFMHPAKPSSEHLLRVLADAGE